MTEKEHQKITNTHYRKFLDEGVIDTIGKRELATALKNVTGKYRNEGKALLITLYYTGARPVEVLDIKAKDFGRKDSYVTIHLRGSKGGVARTLFLRYDDKYVQELYGYARGIFPEMLAFYHFRNNYERTIKTSYCVCGKKKHAHPTEKCGKFIPKLKTRIDTTDKLRYYVKKWFKGVLDESIPPYFLRHNRFSKLMQEGMSDKDIQMLKGSKSIESVQPYLHMSTKRAKDLAKHIK